MKILLAGPILGHDEYSEINRRIIEAASHAGLQVAARNVGPDSAQPPSEPVRAALAAATAGCEAVVQSGPPDLYKYEKRHGRNFCLPLIHTRNLTGSTWPTRVAGMDGCLCVSNYVWASLWDANNHDFKPTFFHLTQVPADKPVYKKDYGLHPQIKKEKAGDFLFYFVGSMDRRENVSSLLRAFHVEFSPNEPVNIVMKFNSNTLLYNGQHISARDYCNTIKAGTKMYRPLGEYKQEIIIQEDNSKESLYSLHQSCDCFVTASHGEAWCIGAMDALLFGKTPIAPDYGGFRDYLWHGNSWLVKTYETNVFGMQDVAADMYYGEQVWCEVDILALRKAMREAYESQKVRDQKRIMAESCFSNLSLGAFAQRLRKALAYESAVHHNPRVAGA